ncbi:SDR family oxidoreductase [Archangium sp.]|uniref:SDR family oxidoreductase n=1 Tax=Archangium sp. TaxID=1872627 RepID=UPI0039C8B27E
MDPSTRPRRRGWWACRWHRRTWRRRMGQPEEIGEALVWLSSSAASFITGAALPVDGGIVAQ